MAGPRARLHAESIHARYQPGYGQHPPVSRLIQANGVKVFSDEELQKIITLCRTELLHRAHSDSHSKTTRPLEVRGSRLQAAVGHLLIYVSGVIINVRDEADVTNWVEITLSKIDIGRLEQAI